MKILQIVRCAANASEDKNSTYYQNSIIKAAEAAGHSVDVTIANNSKEYDIAISRSIPTLVLEPCIFIGKPIFNAEQAQTARAICNRINSLGPAQFVTIINRSELIGKPLANLLLSHNHSVCLLHSKTPLVKLKQAAAISDVVVTATGCDLRSTLQDIQGPMYVDPSNDMFKHPHTIETMGSIGRLTTDLLINDCIELVNLIESKGW